MKYKVASFEIEAIERMYVELRTQAAEIISAQEGKKIEEANELNIVVDMSYRTSSTGTIGL